MNIKFLWVAMLCVFMGQACYSHNPRETFSTLDVQDEHLNFRLELPWSLTRAIVKRFPEMDRRANKDVFYAYIKGYLIENIEIQEEKGQPAVVEQITIVEGEHGHSLIIDLSYRLTGMSTLKVQNTTLFNLDSEIINYHHLLFANGEQLDFSTTKNQPSFTIATATTEKFYGYTGILVFLLFVMGSLLLVFFLNKRTDKTVTFQTVRRKLETT